LRRETASILILGKPIAINLYFKNNGPAEGDNAGGFAKVYLVKGSETPKGLAGAKKDAIRQFQHDLNERTIHGSPIEFGEQGAHWFTATSDRNISQDDIDSVTIKQSQIIYLLSRTNLRTTVGSILRITASGYSFQPLIRRCGTIVLTFINTDN
jgi:hypothetical protein